MRRYLLVSGDSKMPKEPIIFLDDDNNHISALTSSIEETDAWSRYVAEKNFTSLDQLATRFPYCVVEIGELSNDVESLVENLKQVLDQQRQQRLVEAEQRQVIEQMPKVQSAVLRIGNRLRTGQNERQR